jgi:hypothetical protein
VGGKWLQPDIEINGRTRDFLETAVIVYLVGLRLSERPGAGGTTKAQDLTGLPRSTSLSGWSVPQAATALLGMAAEDRRGRWENERSWQLVERLAAQLLKRGTMGGREVQEQLRLLRECDPNSDRRKAVVPKPPLTWSGRRDSNPRPPPWQGDSARFRYLRRCSNRASDLGKYLLGATRHFRMFRVTSRDANGTGAGFFATSRPSLSIRSIPSRRPPARFRLRPQPA